MSATQPKNFNNATVNNFKFLMGKIPEVEYFCQSVNIPSITLGEAIQATPILDRPLPGDKLTYGEMSIEFIIDEEFRSWEALHNWMVSIGKPVSTNQYDFDGQFTDATLILTTNNSNPLMEIRFIDIYPTSLGDLNFTTQGNADPLIGDASFRFRGYEINRL
jgi:hypothetical protein